MPETTAAGPCAELQEKLAACVQVNYRNRTGLLLITLFKGGQAGCDELDAQLQECLAKNTAA